MGCVDLGNIQEGHCFNIVKTKNNYVLLDYSVPVAAYNSDGKLTGYYPFTGTLSNEEFIDFTKNGTIKSFPDYYYNNNKKEYTEKERKYVIGKYKIEKEEISQNIR